MKKLTVNYLKKCKFRDMCCSEVAKEFGAKFSTVYGFCKRNNIKLRKGSTGGHNVKDMTGQVIGSLVVLSRKKDKNSQLAMWKCKCVCGKTCVACGADLRQGKIKTCGCRKGIESKRNWQGYGEIPKSYWSSLNKNAKRRNKHFDLTIEYVYDLFLSQGKKCNLSGVEISFKDKTASLDRIDNEKGYIMDNVQWVHKDINRMKQKFSLDCFITWCTFVAGNQR